MRDIKFRAWDKFNACFYYQNYKTLSDFFAMVQLCIDGGNEVVIQQFTGLYDKYKKEIYEGDIVKWEFEFNSVNHNYKQRRTTTSVVEFENGLFKAGNGDVEVIGNIFQNPIEPPKSIRSGGTDIPVRYTSLSDDFSGMST